MSAAALAPVVHKTQTSRRSRCARHRHRRPVHRTAGTRRPHERPSRLTRNQHTMTRGPTFASPARRPTELTINPEPVAPSQVIRPRARRAPRDRRRGGLLPQEGFLLPRPRCAVRRDGGRALRGVPRRQSLVRPGVRDPRLRPPGRVRQRPGGEAQLHGGLPARHLRLLPRGAGEDEIDGRGPGSDRLGRRLRRSLPRRIHRAHVRGCHRLRGRRQARQAPRRVHAGCRGRGPIRDGFRHRYVYFNQSPYGQSV